MLTAEMFTLQENNIDLLLNITPLTEPVTEDDILKALASSAYHAFRPSAVGLTEAVKRFAQCSKTSCPAEPSSTPIIIAQRLDSVITIELAKDKMTAFACVTAAWGGQRLTEEMVDEALAAAGVTHGIRVNNIVALISTLNKTRAGQVLRTPVAKGKEAVNGKDTQFERLVETLKERIKQPKKLSGGKVDMRDLGALISVSKGKPLMRKYPHTLGEDGCTVMGEAIPHKEGNSLEFDPGKNTEVSTKNPNYLVATETGMPIEIERGMIVDDVLMIDNVDVGFGHVDFDGSILIKGNVCDGMKVKATGDISVSGIIESADVEAGGDLIIEKGVIGHHTDSGDHFSCHLTARGEIVGVFAQYTKIVAHGAVRFSHQLIHCDVTCFDQVAVFDTAKRKGTILGGTIRALKGVTAVNVGAEASTRTEVVMLGDLAAKQLERKMLEQEIEEQEQKLIDINLVASKVELLPDSEKKTTLEHRLGLSRQHEMARINDSKQRVENITLDIANYLSLAKLNCSGFLYSGVFISLDEHRLTTEREHRASVVSLQEGKLEISLLS